jgi:hypothetical protein
MIQRYSMTIAIIIVIGVNRIWYAAKMFLDARGVPVRWFSRHFQDPHLAQRARRALLRSIRTGSSENAPLGPPRSNRDVPAGRVASLCTGGDGASLVKAARTGRCSGCDPRLRSAGRRAFAGDVMYRPVSRSRAEQNLLYSGISCPPTPPAGPFRLVSYGRARRRLSTMIGSTRP